MSVSLRELLRAASQLERFFTTNAWRFCFIGGVAVQRWGEPRFTEDIDLTLITGFGGEEHYVDAILQALDPRLPDAKGFAIKSRVLLVRTSSGVEVDIALGALPFEERTVERATKWILEDGIVLTTCSAEDLLVHKLFAGRPLDWGDLESVLTRQHKRLNLAQVRSEVEPLLELKGDRESLLQFDRLVATVGRRVNSEI